MCESAQALWGLVLTQPKREVLRAYLDCADTDGVSRPGVKRISWMTDYSDRQVQRITHALEQDGLLEGTLRWGKATEYRFNLSEGVTKPPYIEERANVTPDITVSPPGVGGDTVMSPPEMSPVTLDVTPSVPSGDIQVSPPGASHTSAGAAKQILKSLSTQEQEQGLKDKSGGGGDNADARAKVFDQYTALTKHGIDSLIVSQQLLADVEDYTQEWVDEAVVIAALNGATNWNYVRKMLQTWKRDGKDTSRPASVKGKFPNGNSNRAHAPPAAASTSEGYAGLKRKAQQQQEAKDHAP